MNIEARGGYSYFITFIDDFSIYGYIYLIKKKSEALDYFREYKAEIENKIGRNIKALKSDRGEEYSTELFGEFCREHGIVHSFTTPHTPEQNGIAERRNRTLMEMVRSMMALANLPTSF